MSVKISALPSAAALAGAEQIPAVQSGVTNKTTAQAIGTFVTQTSTSFSQAGTGAVARTPQAKMRDTISVLDYGLVAGDASAATANTAALIQLISPTATGGNGALRGTVIFPGAGVVYYFNGMIDVDDGIELDLQGNTLNFAKAYAAADQYRGFLNFIRRVAARNGYVVVNYNGSAGTNAGMALRVGSRLGYPFGGYTGQGAITTGVSEELLTELMGLCTVEDLTITTNNPVAPIILALGGINESAFKRLRLNGGTGAGAGIYYEFGDWHYEAAAANRKTSHAYNLTFEDIYVTGLDGTLGSDAVGLALVGAANANVNGLVVDGAYGAFEARPGEALFYNRGTPYVSVARVINLANVSSINTTGVGIQLIGSGSAAGGYLAGAGLTNVQQTNLQQFTLKGFRTAGTAYTGVTVSGACLIEEGFINAPGASGGLIITDDVPRFTVERVRITGGAAYGIRGQFDPVVYTAGDLLKRGRIAHCDVSGCTSGAILLANCAGVEVVENKLGYQLALDGVAETVQPYGVVIGNPSGSGVSRQVDCRGNDVRTNAGTAYYNIPNDVMCNVSVPVGENTTSGYWERDGVPQRTQGVGGQLNDKTNSINTAGKYVGRQCYDTSDKKLFVAQGTGATDTWVTVDGATTVTPA